MRLVRGKHNRRRVQGGAVRFVDCTFYCFSNSYSFPSSALSSSSSSSSSPSSSQRSLLSLSSSLTQNPAQINADNTYPTPTGLIDVACTRENPDMLVTNTDFHSNKTVLQYECSNIYRRKAGTASRAPTDDRVKNVHWSPLGVAVGGRCCLAVLTKSNRVVVHAASNRMVFKAASGTSSMYLSSAEKWPFIQDVSEELATLYKEIDWKSLPFEKEDGDEDVNRRTGKDVEKDDMWKPINCFAAPGPPKVCSDINMGIKQNSNDINNTDNNKTNEMLPQSEGERNVNDKKYEKLGEARVGQLRKDSRCEVKRDSLSSPWFTCTVLAAESDMCHRVRVRYDRKGLDNEWIVVSDVDNLGDESVQCGRTTNSKRSTMKVKRWIRPAATEAANEVNIFTCSRGFMMEIYKGHCWQLIEVVQNSKIRFETNGLPQSVVSNECAVRKVRIWKGVDEEKQGDDGWEIVDDLKNIRLPAKQLEDEEEQEGKEKEKPEAKKAPPTSRKATKKTPETRKRKAATRKKKDEDDDDYEEDDVQDGDDDDEEEEDDDDYDIQKERKKRARKPRVVSQERVTRKTMKADVKAKDYFEITNTHPNGLTNATKVSFTSCAWSPSFKDGMLESILTVGTKNGELVFFRVGTKKDDEIEEPFCELLGVFRAFLTPGVWVSAIDWMPMKDRDIGDKLWTCAVGSSSGEAKLFFCDPKLLCNRRLNVKVPEDWVIPSSHFHLKEILVESADDVPITSIKCYRDQHVDGRRGLYEGKDVKVVALGKASGEVLLFRSDNISSRIRMFSEPVQDMAYQRCDIGLRVAVCAESGRRADVILQTKKKRDQGQASNEDFILFDFSEILNKDFHTSSNVSVWQRSVRAGGMCASPNSFIIARTFERYDYARLPSMQKLQKIKGKRGILTFHGASAVDGDALTKKIFSLVNEFEGQSLWDCVELCLRSKMYWNAVAKWSSHEMKKKKSSASQQKKYVLGAAFAFISALLRKNSSRQPLLPTNTKIYDSNEENNKSESRVLVHVDQPEKGWVPESQRLKQRRRNIVLMNEEDGEEGVLSFDCQVCGPAHDDDDNIDKSSSFRADLRCETCGLLSHESVGNDFQLKPSMV